MDKQQIIKAVGRDRYYQGSLAARAAASHFGMAGHNSNNAPLLDVNLPHDVGDIIFDSNVNLSNKVGLIFEVYKDIPTYWLIALIALHWDELSKDARDVFWDETRRFLSQDDTSLVNPLGYALAVDFFEDGRKLDEAWNALVRSSPNKRLLERVLTFSGPVPSSYVDKLRTRLEGLYETLD